MAINLKHQRKKTLNLISGRISENKGYICGKDGHSFMTIIFQFYVCEPCVILWENTAHCYAGSSQSTCKMIAIIVSVLNEIKRLVCLFHSDSLILIDQGTNIIEIKNMGEI